MATRLVQIVAFVNVAPGATAALPHQINLNGVPQAPDFVATDVAGFGVTVTTTQVSVTNNNANPTSVNVWLELKHSIPRELGRGFGDPFASLLPRPFIVTAGGSGGSGQDLAWYGTGIDGDHVAVDGEQWIIDPGPVPPTNVMKLWNNVTIPAGATVRAAILGAPEGAYVFIRGTLTIEPGGFLIADGTSAIDDVPGLGCGGSFGALFNTNNGVAGVVGPAPGLSGQTSFPVPQRSQQQMGLSPGQDVGGIGGNSSTQMGGGVTPTTNAEAYPYTMAILGALGGGLVVYPNGGGGGASGASENAGSTSGAGGGGGGVIYLFARHIVAPPGAIRARAGNGGNAVGTDAGGGGGGSGGTIVILTSDPTAPVCDVSGGIGGAGVGPGTAGENGHPGTIVVMNPELGLLFSSP